MTKTPPLSIVSGEAGISPPRPLSHEGKALWDRVQHEYMVQDTGGCELLCLAGEALDRAQSLGAAIEKDGPVVYTRTGVPKTHPAVKEELACRAFVAKTLERLGVTTETVKSPGRPPKPGNW